MEFRGVFTTLVIASVLLVSCTSNQPETSAGQGNRATAEKNEVAVPSRTIAPADVLNQVYLLKSFNQQGEEVSLGSGFLHDGAIVTNAHVIADASWIQVYNASGEHITTAPYAVHVDTENDLAVLPFPGNADPGLPVASATPAIGTDIWAFGSPMGFQNTVSKGNVSSFRKEDGKDLIQITAPISAGSSGGPVTNTAGQVVGVVVGLYSEGQNINFAVPISKLPSHIGSLRASVKFPEASEIAGEEKMTEEQWFMLFSAMRSKPVTYGETTIESMGVDDQVGEARIKIHMFTGYAGQKIEVAAYTANAVVSLMLYQAEFDQNEGDWSVIDEGGGLGTASVIRTTLPQDGDYFLASMIKETDVSGTPKVGYWFGNVPQAIALSERWEAVGNNNKNGKSTELYIDTSSVTKAPSFTLNATQSNAKAWFYFFYEDPLVVNTVEYDAVMTHVTLFCTEREYQILETIAYNGDGNKRETGYNPRSAVTPGTLNELMWEAGCARVR